MHRGRGWENGELARVPHERRGGSNVRSQHGIPILFPNKSVIIKALIFQPLYIRNKRCLRFAVHVVSLPSVFFFSPVFYIHETRYSEFRRPPYRKSVTARFLFIFLSFSHHGQLYTYIRCWRNPFFLSFSAAPRRLARRKI